MKRKILSLVMVLALLLTNAAGYHCHGSECSADTVLSVMDHTHDHDHDDDHGVQGAGNDEQPDSQGNDSAMPEVGAHSHAFDPAVASSTLTPPGYSIRLTHGMPQVLVLALSAVKPALEPPSRS